MEPGALCLGIPATPRFRHLVRFFRAFPWLIVPVQSPGTARPFGVQAPCPYRTWSPPSLPLDPHQEKRYNPAGPPKGPSPVHQEAAS